MYRQTTPLIAGPTDHPQVGSAARNAQRMMQLRDRITQVAKTATPPRRTRVGKGKGRWPAHIPLGSI